MSSEEGNTIPTAKQDNEDKKENEAEPKTQAPEKVIACKLRQWDWEWEWAGETCCRESQALGTLSKKKVIL